MKNERIFIFKTPRFLAAPSIDRVILTGDTITEIKENIEKFGSKVIQVHFFGDTNASGPLRESYENVVKVFPKSKEEIVKNSDMIKQNRYFVCPGFPVEKLEDISFIAAMGINVDLLYTIDEIELDVLLELVDFYLHNPDLSVPVEPFHSILKAKLDRSKLNLWQLYMLYPGRFFYVHHSDAGGGISGEPNSPNQEEYLYSIDWNANTIKQFPNKHPVQVYLDSLPQENPECMSCAHFNFCFGWAKYKKDICNKWFAVLNRLQGSVKEIRGMMNKMNKMDKNPRRRNQTKSRSTKH